MIEFVCDFCKTKDVPQHTMANANTTTLGYVAAHKECGRAAEIKVIPRDATECSRICKACSENAVINAANIIAKRREDAKT